MNPRIRELWDQAAALETNPSWEGQTRFMDKFAELIVQECAEVSKNYAGGSMPLSIALAIKQHFGVEP